MEKVTVYDLNTGEALQRWPIDARECVASGAYSFIPPESGETGESGEPEAAAKAGRKKGA